MDEEQFIKGMAQMLGMDDESVEKAELEVTAATVEAEESLKAAVRASEEENGKKAFVVVDGERYVALGMVEAILSGVAKGFLPEVMKYAVMDLDNGNPYMEGRLSAVNAIMTIMSALITVGKQADV